MEARCLARRRLRLPPQSFGDEITSLPAVASVSNDRGERAVYLGEARMLIARERQRLAEVALFTASLRLREDSRQSEVPRP
jgi:hypothetical protein